MGASIANGVNQAMKNYMQMKQMRMQMQYKQQMAESIARYHDTMAQNQRDFQAAKTAQVNTGKVHAAYLMDKYGITDGMTEDTIKGVLKNASPQDVNAVTNWAHQRALDGQPMNPDLNMNENRAYQNEVTNATRQTIGQGNNDARRYAADEYGTTRLGVADKGLQGKKYAADAAATKAGTPDTKADLKQLNDISGQMKQYTNAKLALDKPPAPGALPMDDTTKANLAKSYDDKIMDLHGQYQQVHDRISNPHQQPAAAAAPAQPAAGAQQPFYPTPTGAPPAPGQSAGTKAALPWNDRSKANVGDQVTTPQGVMTVGGKNPDGTLMFARPQANPATGVQGQPPAQPQAQPQAVPPQGAPPVGAASGFPPVTIAPGGQ